MANLSSEERRKRYSTIARKEDIEQSEARKDINLNTKADERRSRYASKDYLEKYNAYHAPTRYDGSAVNRYLNAYGLNQQRQTDRMQEYRNRYEQQQFMNAQRDAIRNGVDNGNNPLGLKNLENPLDDMRRLEAYKEAYGKNHKLSYDESQKLEKAYGKYNRQQLEQLKEHFKNAPERDYSGEIAWVNEKLLKTATGKENIQRQNILESQIKDADNRLERLQEAYADRLVGGGTDNGDYLDKLNQIKQEKSQLQNELNDYKELTNYSDQDDFAKYKLLGESNPNNPVRFFRTHNDEQANAIFDPTIRNEVDTAHHESTYTGGGSNQSDRALYRAITDEEADNYSYILGKYGQEEADKYLQAVAKHTDVNGSLTALQEAQEQGYKNPLLRTAESIGLGLITPVEAAKNLISGDEFRTYDDYKLAGRQEALRSGAAEKLTGGNEIGTFLYNTATSAADNLLRYAVGGGIGAATGEAGAAEGTMRLMMGGQVMDSAMKNALDRGLSDSQAVTTALISAVNEELFETISLSNLKAMQSVTPKNYRQLAKNIGKQFLGEGSEEMFTDIGNAIADDLVNGEKSEIRQNILNYMKQGMSEEEAKKQASVDFALQLVESGLSGGITGAAMGGAVAVDQAKSIKANQKYNELFNTYKESGLSEEDAVNTALSEVMNGLQTVRDKEGNVKNYKGLNKSIDKAIASAKTINENVKNIEAEMNGVAPVSEEDIRDNKKDIRVNEVNNEYLTDMQRVLSHGDITTDAQAQQFLSDQDEMVAKYPDKKDEIIKATVDVYMNGKNNAEVFDSIANKVTNTMAKNETSLESKNTTSESISQKEDKPAKVDFKANVNGEEAVITSVNKDNMTVRDSVGNETTIPINAAEMTDGASAAVEQAKQYGKRGSRLYLENMAGNIRNYTYTFNDFYNAGKQGKEFYGRNTRGLDTDFLREVYDAGVQDGSKASKTGGLVRNDARYTIQESEARVLDAVGKAFNVTIQMDHMLSHDANGYLSDGVIHISTSAEKPSLVVFSHEFTHRLEDTSPEAYKAYKDYVIDYLKKTSDEEGNNVYETREIDLKNAYARQGIELSDRELQDELVANATESFLSDTEFIEDLVKENRSLAQQILDVLKQMLEDLKNVFAENYDAKSKEGKALQDDLEAREEALKLWTNAIKNQNKEAIKKNGTRYSLSEKTDNELENNYNKLAEEYDKLAKELEQKLEEGDEDYYYNHYEELGDLEYDLGEIVEQYAKNKGFTETVYHGTQNFGFTNIDTKYSDDKLSFFATDDLTTADSYSNAIAEDSYVRKVSDKSSNAGNYKLYANTDNMMEIEGKGQNWDKIEYDNGNNDFLINKFEELRTLLDEEGYFKIKLLKLASEAGQLEDYLYWNVIEDEEIPEVAEKIYEKAREIDEIKRSWNENDHLDENGKPLDFDSYVNKNKNIYKTRELAKIAKDKGYDGVIYKNIVDNGGRNQSEYKISTVYNFFNPQQQVKSADPVTYDDEGNVIPLSERFNKKNDDIRFSLKEDSEGRQLSPQQQEYFKDSKVRNAEGNLQVLYHQTDADFTVFDPKKKGAGSSDYLTPYGIFMKPGNNNIGLKGNKQMKLYANITNILTVNSRYELEKLLKQNDKIEKGIESIKNIDTEFKEKYDAADKATMDYLKSSSKPGHRTRIKEDPEADRLFKEEQKVLDEWSNAYDVRAAEVKKKVDEYLKSQGYDGVHIIHDEGSFGRRVETFIAFNPNQVKNVDNTTPTDNPDIRFSLKEPVEETKNLIAVHNLRLDELYKTLKLGGFPSPSIAIKPAENGHSNFGETSVVFYKDTIDPRASRKNVIYGGDAWTPVFPTLTRKIDDKKLSKLKDKLGITGDYKHIFDQDIEDVIQSLKNDKLVKEKYIIDNKIPIEKTKKANYRNKNTEDIADYIINNNIKEIDILTNKDIQNTLADLAYPNVGKDSPIFIQKGKARYLDSLNNLDMTLGDDNFVEYVMNKYPSETERKVFVRSHEDIVKDIYDLTHDNVNKTFDEWKYQDDINDYLRKHDKEYTDYLRNLINDADIYGDTYIKRSNVDPYDVKNDRWKTFSQLTLPFNLENVVKEMNSQTPQGNAEWFGGVTTLRSAGERTFKSIAELKKNKDKIKEVSDDEIKALQEEYNKELYGIINDISSYYPDDSIAFSILDVFKEGKFDKASIQKQFDWSKNNKNKIVITDDIVDRLYDLNEKIKNIPRPYFEAKPRRAVGFDEIAYVIIPNNASQELKDLLEENNIDYITYEDGNKEDRTEKLNSRPDVRFSLKEDSEGNKLSKEQQEFFKDSKVVDDNGNLLVMYHGSKEKFTEFNLDAKGVINGRVLGDGFYFTNDKKRADYYGKRGKVFKVYLNIKNPLYFTETTKTPDKIKKILDESNEKKYKEYKKDESWWGNKKNISKDTFIKDNRNNYSYLRDAIYELQFLYGSDENVTSTDDVTRILKDLGYDGIIFDSKKKNEKEIVAFYPNQIKNVDNENPTDNPDIRFSLKEESNITRNDVAALTGKDEYMAAAVKDLEDIMRMKGGELFFRANQKELYKIYDEIADEYHIKDYSKKRFADNVKELFDYIQSVDNPDGVDTTMLAMQIADDMLDKGSIKDTSMEELYPTLQQQLRDYKIKIADQDKADLDGGYNAFRKKYFGTLTLSNDGTEVDSVYEDLASSFPELFPEDITHPGDRLTRIADVADMFRKTVDHIEGATKNESAFIIAQDIINKAVLEQTKNDKSIDNKKRLKAQEKVRKQNTNIKKAKKDIHDDYVKLQNKVKALESINKRLSKNLTKAENELGRQKKEFADWAMGKKQVNKEDKYYKRKYDKLMQEFSKKKVAELQKKYSAERRKNIEKIRKMVNELDRSVRRPDKNHYIPKYLVSSMLDVLRTIDLDSGYRKPDGSETLVYMKLKEMQKQYQEMQNDMDYAIASEYNETIDKAIGRLAEITKGRRLNELLDKDIADIVEIMEIITYQMRTARDLLENEKLSDIKEASQKAREQIKEAGRTFNTDAKLKNLFNRYLNNSLSPVRVMRRLEGYAHDGVLSSLGEELQQGERKTKLIRQTANEMLDELYKDTKAIKALEKFRSEKLTYNIGGKNIVITPDMRAAIYLHSLNEQNMKHVVGNKTKEGSYRGGGIIIPNYQKQMKFNNRDSVKVNAAEKYTGQDAVRLSPSDVNRIIKDMTEYDKRIVELYQQVNEYLTKELNDTTMNLYGFKKATVKNYFPLIVDKSILNLDTDALKFDKTLESFGFLKERVNSAKPIYLEGVMDALERQIDQSSLFSGMAIPSRDFKKVWNYAAMDENDKFDNVNKQAQKAMGSYIDKYVGNLQADLAQARERGDASALLSAFGRGKMATGVLTGNLSVVLKQAASYPTAAGGVLGYRDLLAGLTPKGQRGKTLEKIMNKYTPLYQDRNTAAITGVNINDMNILKRRNPKLYYALTGWIESMDKATVRRLWYASENYVKRNFDYKVGSDDYYEEVAKVWEDTIRKTQPIYDTMNRPEYLRQTNELLKFLMMFKTQALQNVGIMVENYGELKARKRDYDKDKSDFNKKELVLAQRQFKKTVSSQIIQSLIFTGITALVDAFIKHRPQEWADEETGLITPESLRSSIIDAWTSNVIGQLAFGDIIRDLAYYPAKTLITGKEQNRFDLSVPPIEAMNTIINGINKGTNAVANNDIEKAKYYFKQVGETAAQYGFGLPVKNIEKLYKGLEGNIRDIAAGKNPLEQSTDKQMYNRIYLAYQSGNPELAKELSEGYDEDKIKTKMVSKLKEEDTIKEAADYRYKSELDKYQAIVDAYVSLGFDEDWVTSAISSVMNKEHGTTGSGEYNSNDLQRAIDISAVQGSKVANEIYKEKYATYKANGLKNDEAKKKALSSVRSAITGKYKPQYEEGTTSQKVKIRDRLCSLRVAGERLYTYDSMKSWNK